jgi:hypothetical protein
MDSIHDVSETAMERLRILKLSTDAGIATTARYFYMNFKFNYAFGYLTIGKFDLAHQYFTELPEDMNYFDASQFPLRYTMDGVNYVINYDNFSQIRGQFYVAFAESLIVKNQNTAGLEYVRKAMPLLNTNWLKYACYYNAINAKEKLNQYDSECIQFCSLHMNAYYNLSKESIDTILAYNFGTYRLATSALDKSIEKGVKSQESFDHLASAIQILKYYLDPYKEKDEAQRKKNKFILLRWYHEAVMSDYSNKDFIKSAIAFSDAYADPTFNDKLSWLKRYENFTLNCSEIQWLMDEYLKLNLPLEKTRLDPKLEVCKGQEAKALAEAEEARKKQDRQNSRNYRSSNRMPLFYVGLNVFPFLKVPRDLGLAVNFGGKNMVTEFSYLNVKGKPENYFDLSLQDVSGVEEHLWDGYFTHINFKFPSQDWDDGRVRPYVGFLLAYNERTFQPFQTSITHIDTGIITTATVQPTSKQYSGMVNMGYMGVFGFGIDMFMGMGASYNQFNGDLAARGDEKYAISDLMLQHRKDSYWNFIMRIGISIGIGYAKE